MMAIKAEGCGLKVGGGDDFKCTGMEFAERADDVCFN